MKFKQMVKLLNICLPIAEYILDFYLFITINMKEGAQREHLLFILTNNTVLLLIIYL